MADLDPARYAVALARTVDLLRTTPEASEQQKNALRTLVAQAAEHSATFRVYSGVLSCNDIPLPTDSRAGAILAQSFKDHGLEEIVIAREADAGELLGLARGLAAPAGRGRLKERLRDAGSTRVMLILESGTARRPPTVSGAFAKAALDDAVKEEWDKFLTHGAADERMVYVGPTAGKPAPEAATPPPPPPPAPAPQQFLGAAPPPPPAPAPQPAAPQAPALGANPPVRPPGYVNPLPQPPTLTNVSKLAIALNDVERDPYGRDLLQRVTVLGRTIEEWLTKDRVAEAIDALRALIRLEAEAPNEPARSPYGVVMKRTLGRAALTQVAPYLLEPRRAERAATVLQRGEDTSVELLIGLVVSAGTLGERVAYATVLRTIPGGTDKLVRLLTRTEWQVVRNAAEVLGEIRLDESTPYVARLLQHEDERLRRTGLVALARLGTGAAVTPIRTVLQEGTPELRALVAGSIGGEHARAFIQPLYAAADKESKAELVRAYCLALGRIGTDEAVQALAALAEPGGKLIGRRAASTRLSAIDGLRQAGARAADALARLAESGDKAVAPAARDARAALDQPGAAAAR